MLNVLYQDAHVVAIDKPAGLLVHRSMVDRHETQFAVQLLRNQLGQPVFPVHRLDRGTSGVLLFALNSETARELGRQFELQQVHKTYWAVVRGHPPTSGIIDHPLKRQPDDSKYLPTGLDLNAEPQSAITHYQRLATVTLPVQVDRYAESRYALMALHPRTGRRHQLRRHMKHIAHPIIGDATHGKGVHNRYFAQALGCPRLLLACTQMTVIHPWTQQPLTFNAPVGDAFSALLVRLDWQYDPVVTLPA